MVNGGDSPRQLERLWPQILANPLDLRVCFRHTIGDSPACSLSNEGTLVLRNTGFGAVTS
jgi:hypothetical protein